MGQSIDLPESIREEEVLTAGVLRSYTYTDPMGRHGDIEIMTDRTVWWDTGGEPQILTSEVFVWLIQVLELLDNG